MSRHLGEGERGGGGGGGLEHAVRGEDGEAGFVEEREGGELVEEEEGVGIGGEAGLDGLQVEELGRRWGGREERDEREAGGD